MYNLVFIFFYKLSSKRNPDAKGAAKTFVALATFMHLFFLASVAMFAFGIKIPPLDDTQIINKLYFLPVLILWFFFISIFYNKKKINEILNVSENNHIVSPKNILIILLIMVLPAVIAIKLLIHS